VFVFLEDEDAGAFTEYEAVARAVKGAAGGDAGIVARGQGGQAVKAGHAEGVDHAVRAAGDDHVGIAATD